MVKKKKILLVVRWPVGGIRTFMRYVYKDFDVNAYEISILAPDLPELRVLIEEDLIGMNIKYISVKKNPSILIFAKTICKELLFNKYDIVHSHGFTSGIGAVVSTKILFKKHILTSHDVVNDEQFEGYKGKIKKYILGLTLKSVNTIHSVSQDAQNNLISFYPFLSNSTNKCIVIPNGIDVERFENAYPCDFRKEFGLPKDSFLIGFFGRFMSQKGFKFLIEAIEILVKENQTQKYPIVLAFGGGGFVREEREVILNKKLDSYFHFMPFTANIASSIKGVDVVAMPSLWEACGLLAMEVLVSGTPLIATNCIGLREVVQNTPANMVKIADKQSLADAILKIMNCGKSKLTNEYIKKASERFSVKNQKNKIYQLYQN